MAPKPETPQIEPSNPPVQKKVGPFRGWTPEESAKIGQQLVDALRDGLAEKGIK